MLAYMFVYRHNAIFYFFTLEKKVCENSTNSNKLIFTSIILDLTIPLRCNAFWCSSALMVHSHTYQWIIWPEYRPKVSTTLRPLPIPAHNAYSAPKKTFISLHCMYGLVERRRETDDTWQRCFELENVSYDLFQNVLLATGQINRGRREM